MDTSFGDVGKDREITIVVKQKMELDSPLRPAEGSPIKKSGTKVDDRGVKAEEFVLEAKLLLPRAIGTCQEADRILSRRAATVVSR